jgi:hypothetical protein
MVIFYIIGEGATTSLLLPDFRLCRNIFEASPKKPVGLCEKIFYLSAWIAKSKIFKLLTSQYLFIIVN